MNWPTHTDYQDAIQNPQVCFQEPDLKAGEAATDMLGLPRVMSGNFASVYELKKGDTRWAVRCFVRQVPGQQGRYARLSQHLNSLTLDCLVKFEYMLKGILIKGEWFPLVKMDWVEGSPLNTYVEEHLRESETLLKLAADWRVMMKSLTALKLAHGDLQHGNIMVTPKGELRLVDYDGMYAPIFGRGRAPELGHINFQHPRRTADFYEENLDNFSALVIYTSLRALAAEPELWQTFYTVDNLVFTSADFKNPLQSACFAKLKQNKDTAVQQLATLLEKCCISPVESVPDFGEVMTALDTGSLEKVAFKSASAPPPKPLPNAQNAMRSAYDQVPVAAPAQSHSFQNAASTQTQTYTPVAEKEGMPKWIIFAGIAVVAIIVGLVVYFGGKPKSPPASESTTENAVEEAAPDTTAQEPVRPKTSVAAPVTAKSSPFKINLQGTLKGHAGSVDFLKFSRDNKLIASGSADKTIRFWDAHSGQAKSTLNGSSDGVISLGFLPDDKTIFSVSQDYVVRFWDTATGKQKRAIETQKNNLFAVALSPDGNLLATGDNNRKTVRLLDAQTGAVKASLPNHSSWVRSVNFSTDGKLLIVACQDDSVYLWSVAGAKLEQTISAPGNQVELLPISNDRKWLVTGGENNSAKIWNVPNGNLSQTLSGHTAEVKSFAFSPDGKLVATGSADKSVKIWDVSNGDTKQTLTGHSGAVTTVAFSQDGKSLVSGSDDHTIRLYEISR